MKKKAPSCRLEKKDDTLKSAHMHTSHNRQEIEASQICCCISCQTFFKPSEIDSYTDEGATVICPCCDCDAVLGDACGIKLTDDLLEKLHQRYFSYDDMEDTGMEIYITTDLLIDDGGISRTNAVHAFKSKRSVKSYEKYLGSTGENHILIVTPTTVSDLGRSLQVITEFEENGDLYEYKSSTVFDDYDAARDYVGDVRATQPATKAEHYVVKIRSRFSPTILNSGLA